MFHMNWQRINIKYQVLFSLKSNEKGFTIFVCCSRDGLKCTGTPSCFLLHLQWIISFFHGCMVWIEKSVTRVTDRHHEACRVMPNSDPE